MASHAVGLRMCRNGIADSSGPTSYRRKLSNEDARITCEIENQNQSILNVAAGGHQQSPVSEASPPTNDGAGRQSAARRVLPPLKRGRTIAGWYQPIVVR